MKVNEMKKEGFLTKENVLQLLESNISEITEENFATVQELIGKDEMKVTIEDIIEADKAQAKEVEAETEEDVDFPPKETEITGEEETVEVKVSVLNQMMNKIDNLEKKIEGQNVSCQKTEIKNRSNEVYGVRFHDVDILANRVKAVEVKLSNDDHKTAFYGRILGTTSTMQFTAFVIGDQIVPVFDTKDVSENTQEKIFALLLEKIAEAKEMLLKSTENSESE